MFELGVYRERLAESGLRVFERAVEESRHHQQNYVSVGHILKSLAVEDANAFAEVIRDYQNGPPLTDELLEKIVAGGPDWGGSGVRISPQVTTLLRRARRGARAEGREKIEAGDLFSALGRSVKGRREALFLVASTPHSLIVRA